ncbi:MAG TPA: hypothetical protein VHN14_08455 [Kofleriaceae bacterium]|nr:hypothetical protein [Kofleriaceae bacterium]
MTTLASCGSPREDGVDQPDAQPDAQSTSGGLMPPGHGFQVMSSPIEIDPGTELTYCHYFRTSNTSDLTIKQWASHMTPGVHHMIVYLTPQKLREPGTIEADKCGLASIGTVGPIWTYSAQDADHQFALPADDGNGTPVGQSIPAGQYGFIQVHYLNATDARIQAHVELNAYAYDDGIQVTPAGPFVTLNTLIDLPPAASALTPSTGMVNGSCNVSSDAKFYVMTTYTHKQGVHTFVKDGATTVFDSMNWAHPGTKEWSSSPFYSFTSGKLFYQCEYVNPNNYRIQYGDDTATQEMCMAIGYYFPAIPGNGHFCLDSFMLN